MRIDNTTTVNKPVYTDVSANRPKPEMAESQNTQNVPQAAQVLPGAEVQTEVLQEQNGNAENDSRRIKNAVEHANQTMRHAKTKCEFSYHEETKRVSIKVIDAETEEIIREIPPEETLEMISKMWELAGLMVDEKR